MVILPADKGNATVVMDADQYEEKMCAPLETPVYCKINKDPTGRFKRKIMDKTRLFIGYLRTSSWYFPYRSCYFCIRIVCWFCERSNTYPWGGGGVWGVCPNMNFFYFRASEVGSEAGFSA